MQDDKKKVLLSETETEDTKLTRSELVNDIRRVTNLNINDVSKILEIIYLTKHYFSFGEDEQLPDTYWANQCATDGSCLPEKFQHGAVRIDSKTEA